MAISSQDPPPTSPPVLSPSPVKCSSNFSIARLVGETTSPTAAPTILRPESIQHPAAHHHMIHPWLAAAAAGHHLNPYSSVFAPRLAWPHHLPLIPMMHFGNMFQAHHGVQHPLMVVPGATSTPNPPHKLM